MGGPQFNIPNDKMTMKNMTVSSHLLWGFCIQIPYDFNRP